MKVYRRHHCQWHHRGGLDFILCAFPRLEDVRGDGQFAVISWCGPAARLFAGQEEAHEHMDAVTFDGCGDGCSGKHDIVRLDPGPEAVFNRTDDPYADYAKEVAE